MFVFVFHCEALAEARMYTSASVYLNCFLSGMKCKVGSLVCKHTSIYACVPNRRSCSLILLLDMSTQNAKLSI